MKAPFRNPIAPQVSSVALGLFTVALLIPLAKPVEAVDERDIVLRASRVLDGRGEVLEDRDIVVRHGRIVDIVARGSASEGTVYDLTSLTVLPGYIDTHVHITHHFDENGKYDGDEDPDLGHVTLYAVENAYKTLMSGVTTIQSLGRDDDAHLREWIARGIVPGPRVLTSLGAIRASTGSPAELRRYVRSKKAEGADVIKIFASTSIRLGGVTNMTAEQLNAACGEARDVGLRTVVHAHRPDGITLAAEAGCSQIEHGWLADRAALEVIAESGMYFGNQIDLLFRNYAENGERFDGVGSFTMEGLQNLQESRTGALEVFRESLQVPGLNIVYNTDANAGAHGQNAEEIIAYVEQGGQRPMDTIIAATSRAAESLGLGDSIGTIAKGMEADIIALDGDPLTDTAALGRVVFVMRAGDVYRHEPGAVE